jgi:two-component system, sensor histidine kinase PdtaS
MKYCLSFFTFFLLLQQSNAQKADKVLADSLNALLPQAKDDTAKLNLIAEIMFAHVYYKPQEGLAYQKPGLELAQKLNWKPGIAKIKHRAGRLYWRLGNLDASLKYHFEALALYKQTGDTLAEGRVLIEIGQDYLDNGKLDAAKNYLLKALKFNEAMGNMVNIASAYDILCYLYDVEGKPADATKAAFDYLKISEKAGDKTAIGHAAHMLASNYQALGNNADALKYFKQGLQVAQETANKIEQANFNTGIGEVYLSQSNLAQTNYYYSIALKLCKELDDAQMLGYMHRKMGKFYQMQGDFPNALTHYQSSDTAYKSISNKQDLAGLYADMGALFTSLKDYLQAKKSFNNSKALYDGLNSKLSMSDYYSGRERLDSATGNWRSAYQHYKEYVNIRDSSFNKETLQKLVGSELQYENEKKQALAKAEQEKNDVLAKAEIKHQLNIRNASLVALAAGMVFSIVAYRQRNKLAREKKRSDQLLLDKELLLREIHHRVKNNLEVVSSLLALQSAQIDDPNTKDAMQEGQNRVQSIGIVHQKLYQGENLGAIEMKDYFINLSESILDSFGADKKVQIECAMEKLDIDIDTAVPLGLIVNELLTNTLKYAFPDGRDGKVLIKLAKRIDGVLQLEVSDNGVGKSGLTKGTGFGAQLVSLLTQQLSGTMQEDLKDGTKIFFEFKTGTAA